MVGKAAQEGGPIDGKAGGSVTEVISDLAMTDAPTKSGWKRFCRGTHKTAVKARTLAKKHSKVIVGTIIKVCISVGGILLSADLNGNL
ncbi:hypothetical protein RQP46_009760 [Phenoliferia psychrophenolica]